MSTDANERPDNGVVFDFTDMEGGFTRIHISRVKPVHAAAEPKQMVLCFSKKAAARTSRAQKLSGRTQTKSRQ